MNHIGIRQRPAEPAAAAAGADLAELYEQHARTIHRYLARRVGTDLADDLVADTFLVALRNWPSYQPDRGPVIAWLYGIATNLVRGHRRRERSELLASQRAELRPIAVADPAEAVAARLDAARHTRRLSAAVAALKPGDRDVLLLLAWTELSQEQVAQALDIPLGTVRSRLHRARRQLRTNELTDQETNR